MVDDRRRSTNVIGHYNCPFAGGATSEIWDALDIARCKGVSTWV